MMEALKERLRQVQDLGAPLQDAAIAVATDLRMKVRAGKRRASRDRKERRKLLRAGGFSAREVRSMIGRRRRTSGVSIEADSTGLSVVLTASNQVQHLRREQGETADLREAFRKYLPVAAEWRAKRGL